MSAQITHISIQAKDLNFFDPIRGKITDTLLLEIANGGTTPVRVSPALRARADRILAALSAGKVVETSTALVNPITEADFKTGTLTASLGYERI